jgi:manganese/zinc/iron transport system substrate-binding protein
MVADLARGVGGQEVVVEGLMGPGVDPHLYKATSSDLIRLQRAEVILYGGLHLEGKMQETFQRLARSGRRVRAVTDGLPPERLIRVGQDGMVDPHVWFDVELWSRCTERVAEEFAAARPDSAVGFRQRAATVKQELKDLHQWVLTRVATVPKPRRILVTSHDAFGYFGKACGQNTVSDATHRMRISAPMK